jgi:glycosyltransferase involved in cell wall biosynthesis
VTLLQPDKPHIILLAYYFPPSDAVGGARPFRFFKYLQRLGYTCEVVTACEQPPGGTPGVTCVPDRLGVLWATKTRQSLGLGGHFERAIRRFILPGCVGVVWAADAARCCLELARRRQGQKVVLVTTCPPIGPNLVGHLVVLQARIPWIADFRDPMSFGSGNADRYPVAMWILSRLESIVHRYADAVVANAESAAKVWRTRFPWARKRIHVIWNGYDPENRLRALPLAEPPARTIVHAGDLYDGRNPNLIVEAFARLRARGEPETSNARILLVGPIEAATGTNWDVCNAATRDGWLELRKPIPRVEAQRLVAQSAGLLLLQPQTVFQVPAKLFDYISIGRPVLALVPRDSAVEYLLANSGVPYRCIYASDTPAEADRKLLEFLRLPTDPAPFNSWFESNFSAPRQTDQLAAIVQAVVDRSSL